MADYIIYITDIDANNVNSENRGNVLHGFTDNVYNLDQKTYTAVRRGRLLSDGTPFNIPNDQVWGDNILKITNAINTEISKVRSQLLEDKATLYELTHFDQMFQVVKQSSIDYFTAEISRNEAVLVYLQEYQP